MIARISKPASQAPCGGRAYHVNPAQGRWDVVDEDGRIVGHRDSQGAAIDLAIQEAQHHHGAGEDVAVCVEQPDGAYRLAWSSR